MKPMPGGSDHNVDPPRSYPNPLNATPTVKTLPCTFTIGARKCPLRASHVIEVPLRSDQHRPIRMHLCGDHFMHLVMDTARVYPAGDLVTYELEPMVDPRAKFGPNDR